jgi:hypothetical protein
MDIELLQPERLTEWGKRLDFPSEAVNALQRVAKQVRGDAELLAIFTEFHDRTALRGEWHREWSDLPVDDRVQAKLCEASKDQSSLFYLLAYMAALPYTEARYRQLGVGMDIFDDTMKDFRYYLGDYFDLYGNWGYAHFAWIWRHITCELFRLGRLQYMLAPFYGGVTAFRRKYKVDGGAQSLAQSPDGYAYGAGRSRQDADLPSNTAWNPVFEESAAGWRGHLVNPYGCVRPQAVFLPRAEWEVILQKGDTVLDLHIPRKDTLTAETCGASFRQAHEFFPRVFPGRDWKALYCHTWFFTPQLQKFLPPESSIVKFQREFYLYPVPGSLGFLWEFVFGKKYPDPATAPRDTSLRRAVLDWIGQGTEIFDITGVMFHLPEEWGSQPYMRRWDQRG